MQPSALLTHGTALSSSAQAPLHSPLFPHSPTPPLPRTRSNHLLNIINDILDVAALKEGKLTIKHEAVNLAKAVEHVCDIVSPLAKKEVRGALRGLLAGAWCTQLLRSEQEQWQGLNVGGAGNGLWEGRCVVLRSAGWRVPSLLLGVRDAAHTRHAAHPPTRRGRTGACRPRWGGPAT